MKVVQRTSSNVRRVLLAMCTDPVVAARIAPKWHPPMFDQQWANLIGNWAITYYRKYEKVIGSEIESRYDQWAAKASDEDLIRLVGNFLTFLDSEYDAADSQNSDYFLDLAAECFTAAALQREAESIQALLEDGQVSEATKLRETYRPINLGPGEFLEPEKDMAIWNQAFDRQETRSLFTYPGELGKMIGGAFHREGFIAFMGVEKAGKSYALMDASYRALRKRLRVAYFEAGDLGQDEVIFRLGQRCAKLPKYAGELYTPTVRGNPSNSSCAVRFEKKRYDTPINAKLAYKAFLKVTRQKSLLRISTHPNSSLTVSEIDSMLEQWATEEWVPDVIVIDYADILAPPPGYQDTKDQIDEVWKHLRRLSQKWHCLLLTATQASANAYSQSSAMSRKNFSGRKTKLAHVSGMIGLNHFPVDDEDDEESDILKKPKPVTWNWVVRREDSFSEHVQVDVYGNLAIGCPVLASQKRRNKKKDD